MTSEFERNDETQRRGDALSDFIKKGISTGVKSVLLTEEGLRNTLGELMPKEISATVKAHVDGLKKELYSTVVKEFSQFLEHMDIATELKKVLEGMRVEIHTEVTFTQKEKTQAKRKK
jgi:hypothetical protein